MRLKVLKFGGTSLCGEESWEKVIRWILSYKRQDYALVVVVSAMGRDDAPYSTDRLIDLAESFCDQLPSREMDLIMSCGETISSVAMAGALRSAGLNALALTGRQAGIITDDDFGNARILRIASSGLLRILHQDQVAVVAGFQGVTEKGDITTLGRGGSDITAAALGVALQAEMVEIFTDVNGVKTADPRLVPEARTLGIASYEEINELAEQGAEVVHPRACQLAMAGNVPFRIRSTFNQHPGTIVTNGTVTDERTVTGVTQVPEVTQMNINGDQKNTEEVFGLLADGGISVDLINVSPQKIVLTVADDKNQRARKILREGGYQADIHSGCAKVSLVGAGMRGTPGVMARIVQALNEADIKILQTCDSHMSINCLVHGEEMADAVRALHSNFELERGGGVFNE